MAMFSRRSLGLLCVSLLVLTGCFGDGFPETYPVNGVVTYQGEPIEGATVSLVPTDPQVKSAGGQTDAEGKFEVTTYFSPQQQPAGAMPGEYTVTVRKKEKREVDEELDPQEEMAALMKLGPPKDLLPKKYGSPNTSDLKVTISDAPPEPLELNL